MGLNVPIGGSDVLRGIVGGDNCIRKYAVIQKPLVDCMTKVMQLSRGWRYPRQVETSKRQGRSCAPCRLLLGMRSPIVRIEFRLLCRPLRRLEDITGLRMELRSLATSLRIELRGLEFLLFRRVEGVTRLRMKLRSLAIRLRMELRRLEFLHVSVLRMIRLLADICRAVLLIGRCLPLTL